jgi:hypothetical protein
MEHLSFTGDARARAAAGTVLPSALCPRPGLACTVQPASPEPPERPTTLSVLTVCRPAVVARLLVAAVIRAFVAT